MGRGLCLHLVSISIGLAAFTPPERPIRISLLECLTSTHQATAVCLEFTLVLRQSASPQTPHLLFAVLRELPPNRCPRAWLSSLQLFSLLLPLHLSCPCFPVLWSWSWFGGCSSKLCTFSFIYLPHQAELRSQLIQRTSASPPKCSDFYLPEKFLNILHFYLLEPLLLVFNSPVYFVIMPSIWLNLGAL